MPCRSVAVGEEARQYLRELTEVLATLDLDRVKGFYRKWEKAMELPPLPDDRRLEMDMHMMILELPGLEHLHRDSQEWLLTRGLAIDIREINCGKLNLSEAGKGHCRSGVHGAGADEEQPNRGEK